MKVNGVQIDDTYAEAFPVYVARVLITGATTALAETAAIVATGFATSVIGCSAEAGIDRYVVPQRDSRWQTRCHNYGCPPIQETDKKQPH